MSGEYMMGHKVGQIHSYFKPTDEELWHEFKKALPTLTIDKSEQLRIKNQHQEEEIMRYDVEAIGKIESLEKQIHGHKIDTLKLVREALQNSEKFKKS